MNITKSEEVMKRNRPFVLIANKPVPPKYRKGACYGLHIVAFLKENSNKGQDNTGHICIYSQEAYGKIANEQMRV